MIHLHADNYNVQAWDSDGNQHLLHANQLCDWDLHHWQGWRCHAGVDYIYVHENGDVWSGLCENTYLGNLFDGATLLSQPGTCQQPTCTTCTTDLQVTKNPPL